MKTPDGKSIAFIHIDTNFLAYGEDGEPNNNMMHPYFYKYQWETDDIMERIEELIEKHKDCPYKIMVGHHPIGHLCGRIADLR